MHNQRANVTRILQADIGPRFAAVDRLVNAIAMRDVAANASLAVGGFPDAAGNGSEIVGVRLTDDARHGQNTATTKRAHEPPLHSFICFQVDGLLRGERRNQNEQANCNE